MTIFTAGADTPAHIAEETQYFRLGEADITPIIPHLDRLRILIDSLQASGELRKVNVTGSASPDGPAGLNRELAARRAANVADWLIANSSVRKDQIATATVANSWSVVRHRLEDPVFAQAESPYREQVIRAIADGGSPDSVQTRLKAIDGRKAWLWLETYVLPRLRYTRVTVACPDKEYTHTLAADDTPQPEQSPLPGYGDRSETTEITVTATQETVTTTSEDEEWRRKLYIKTNIPAWAMLWTNIAVEADIAPHWSFTLPVYYSGFNYFTGHTKFHTLTLQPEFRYWPKADNTGFFAGAHFGLGWYNVAFGGDKRYQDHNRDTPAIGGGIAVGYRFYFCRDRRWQMEASIGAGIYRLDYDVFRNHHNGLIIDRRQRTFYGIDQAAFTVSYRFDLKRKGGSR